MRGAGWAQGSRLRKGRPGHGRLEDSRGLCRPVRLDRDRSPSQGRCGLPGQDEHGRVRDGIVHRALRLRPNRQPVGPHPRSGRKLRRLCRRRGRFPRPSCHRNRHRREHPPARVDVRRGRPQAYLRPGQPLRHRGLRQQPGPDRALRPRRPRRGGPAPHRRGPRRARRNIRADSGAAGTPEPPRRGRRGGRLPEGQAPGPAPRVLRRRHGAGSCGARP